MEEKKEMSTEEIKMDNDPKGEGKLLRLCGKCSAG